MILLQSDFRSLCLHRPLGKNNSAFNRVSTAYLRLKSIELGYTFPKLKQIPNASLRVYANAYNLLTFTGVKFVDPEHPDDDLVVCIR